MASKKQILANRNNALKSTGPKTADGKYWSSHLKLLMANIGLLTIMSRMV